jgi:hypothetical protein
VLFGFELDELGSVPFTFRFGKAGFSRLWLVKTKLSPSDLVTGRYCPWKGFVTALVSTYTVQLRFLVGDIQDRAPYYCKRVRYNGQFVIQGRCFS